MLSPQTSWCPPSGRRIACISEYLHLRRLLLTSVDKCIYIIYTHSGRAKAGLMRLQTGGRALGARLRVRIATALTGEGGAGTRVLISVPERRLCSHQFSLQIRWLRKMKRNRSSVPSHLKRCVWGTCYPSVWIFFFGGGGVNPGMFNQSFNHNMMLLKKETVKLKIKIKDAIDPNLSRKRILVSWPDCWSPNLPCSLIRPLVQEPPPSEADAVPAGRSLRVPVELEFATSCFPRCPAPQQSHDLVWTVKSQVLFAW